jgi:hypothetical protein
MPASPEGNGAAEPVSPELILVAPPAEAQAAREQLGAGPDSDRDDVLAPVRPRPPEARVIDTTTEPVGRHRRWRRPAAVAGAAILVGLAVGILWQQDRGPQLATQQPATQRAATVAGVATSRSDVSPAAPAPQKKQTRKQTSVASKQTHSTGVRRTKPAVPTPPPVRRKHVSGFVPARTWSWIDAPGTQSYLVRFFRNGHRVLAVRTGRPRLVLPKRFTFRAGRYRWTVVPISARGRPGRALVDSTFAVSAGRKSR